MKIALGIGISLLASAFSSAQVLVLTKGQVLPDNARPFGLKGMREFLKQIDEGTVWLNTSEGDISCEYLAWQDKRGRFTIGWDLENGAVQQVYYYKGTPEWKRGKMRAMKWPRSGSIFVDLESGELIVK